MSDALLLEMDRIMQFLEILHITSAIMIAIVNMALQSDIAYMKERPFIDTVIKVVKIVWKSEGNAMMESSVLG